MSNNLNEKNITLILNKFKYITIKLINFATTTSLSLLIQLSMSIEAIPHMETRIISALGINKIDLSFLPKLLTQILSTIGISPITITTIMKVINREELSITMFLPFVFNLKRNLRSITSINEQKINFSFTPVVATFRKLSEFDPQTLGTLDSNTLSQMDHT